MLKSMMSRRKMLKSMMSRRKSSAEVVGVVDYERTFVVLNSRNVPIMDLLTDVCRFVDQDQVEAVNGSFGDWLIQLKEKEVCKVVAKAQMTFHSGRASFPPITTLSLPKVFASVRESDLRKSLQRYGDVISAIQRSPVPVCHSHRWRVKMYIPEDMLEAFPKSFSIETEGGRADDFDVFIESSRCLFEEHSLSEGSVASGKERKRKASPVRERTCGAASVPGHLDSAVRRASSTGSASESNCQMQSELHAPGPSSLHETKKTSTPPVKEERNLSSSTSQLRMEGDARTERDKTPLKSEEMIVVDEEAPVYVIKLEASDNDDLVDVAELPFAGMRKRQRLTMDEYRYWVGEKIPCAEGILTSSEFRGFLLEARETKRFMDTVGRYVKDETIELILQLESEKQLIRNTFKEEVKIHPLKNIMAMIQTWIRRLKNIVVGGNKRKITLLVDEELNGETLLSELS